MVSRNGFKDMGMTVEVRDGNLFFDDRKIVTSSFVKEFVLYQDLVVLLLKPQGSPDNNVIAVDANGKEVWRAPISDFDVSSNGNYYNGVGVYDGELRVFHFLGIYYIANPLTGSFERGTIGRSW